MRSERWIVALMLAICAALPQSAHANGSDDSIVFDDEWSASIPLESREPHHAEYLGKLRQAIKAKWVYPCIKDAETGRCEYKTTTLVLEFGVRKNGTVAFVKVLTTSGFLIYDEYAAKAVKQAAPFPPIPDSVSTKGVPIHAMFNYVVEPTLTNILR